MDRWSGKVAVVTGASAGIGLATAKALVRNGMIVVGLARRVEKMQNDIKDVGPGKFYAKECDITNEQAVVRIFEWIEKNLKTVHILVNNAGVMKARSLLEIKTEEIQQVLNVNVMGLLHCTRHALKLMKKHDHEAHIVNINSTSGHKVPFYGILTNVYPATKHAVTALCQSLIIELQGTKIRVSSVSPGIVKTEIFDIAEADPNVIKEKPALNPEDVADSIVHVISAPQHVQITELIIKPLGQIF